MLYQKPSFTLPTTNKPLTQREWDKKILTAAEFKAKYPRRAKGEKVPND